MLSNKELKEAGLKLAKSNKAKPQFGTEFLDRTIYHTVVVTGPDGKPQLDIDGNIKVDNRPYKLAASWVSPALMEECLKVEKEHAEINEAFRKDMEERGIRWRFKKSEFKAMSIEGIT